MQLISSSYLPSWDLSAKSTLFAGHWCIPYNLVNVAEGLPNSEILHYHWEDQNNVNKDVQKLYMFYEELLQDLARQLNSLHNVQYSIRYWRIVIGPWLFDFIRMVFDAYTTITTAHKEYQITSTNLAKFDFNTMAPWDFEEFHRLCSDPFWNHCLFGLMIKKATNIKINYFDVATGEAKLKPISYNYFDRLKKVVKLIFSFCYSKAPIKEGARDIVFVQSYFSTSDLIKLQKKLNQIPMPFFVAPNPPRMEMNRSMRVKVKIDVKGENGFKKIIKELIPYHIPRAYLEGYSRFNAIRKWFFPRWPKAIHTANAYHYNEAFKVWAAHETEGDTKLLISQHGGYGETLWSTEESHMISISDVFFSWGWGGCHQGVRVLPSNKLNFTRKLIQRTSDKGILFVVNSDVVNNMHSEKPMLSGNEFIKYRADLLAVFFKLRPFFRDQVKFRLYHTSYKRAVWGLSKYLQDNLPEQNIDSSSKSFYQAVSENALTVITYHPAATSLETLSANVPTMLFWASDQMLLNDKAAQIYNIFEEVGIFHRTRESLVAKIELVMPSVDDWWYSEEVQNAVRLYQGSFCLTADDCVDVWAREIVKYFQQTQLIQKKC